MYEKLDLVECSISRNNHITPDIRPLYYYIMACSPRRKRYLFRNWDN